MTELSGSSGRRRLVNIILLIASIGLVALLRGVGICLAIFMYIAAMKFGLFVANKQRTAINFWIYGQLLVPLAVLLLSLPFCSQLLTSNILHNIAETSWLKLPIDKVMLALTSQSENYPYLLFEINRNFGDRPFILSKYPAIFAEILSAMVWFCFALPRTIGTSTPIGATQNSKHHILISTVCIFFALLLHVETLFLGTVGRGSFMAFTTVPMYLTILVGLTVILPHK
jgi:hypothetical protein